MRTKDVLNTLQETISKLKERLVSIEQKLNTSQDRFDQERQETVQNVLTDIKSCYAQIGLFNETYGKAKSRSVKDAQSMVMEAAELCRKNILPVIYTAQSLLTIVEESKNE